MRKACIVEAFDALADPGLTPADVMPITVRQPAPAASQGRQDRSEVKGQAIGRGLVRANRTFGTSAVTPIGCRARRSPPHCGSGRCTLEPPFAL